MKNLIFFAFFFISWASEARFIVEPTASAEAGTWEGSYQSDSTSSTSYGNVQGWDYGLKFLYKIKFVELGLSGNFASVSWGYNKADDFAQDDSWVDASAAKINFGLSGAINVTSKISLVGTYYFYDRLKLDQDHDPTLLAPTLRGSAYSLGAAYAFKPWLKLAFQYRQDRFTSKTVGETTQDLPSSFGGITYDPILHVSYVFTLSMPFEFSF